ncbi:MAG TPA: cell division protein ZapE [Alphaproteobacteria bacterium]|nr:cell division protein ZapE [Alphaproteobacteria bacterium]HCO89461.1 cell division protein ZapE [Alphaproteobacteria bacterium]
MSLKGPAAAYRDLLETGEVRPDPEQALAVEKLQALDAALAGYRPAPPPKRGLRALFGNGGKQAQPAPKGIYIHGEVGRGKSMLMDLFFEHAPVAAKRRLHFLQFMLETHEAIHAWRQAHKNGDTAKSDGDDPIPPVARRIAEKAQLLCFDEFQVSDVADAMILGRLFSVLFDLGVIVVATSNRAPRNLYEGGLNRQLFLPFIDMIEARLEVLHLDSDTDYRLERISGHPVYHQPLGETARAEMDAAWRRLTDLEQGEPVTLSVQGRELFVPQAAKGVARISFHDLCEKPLGGPDYLKLAWSFHTVLIDDIPQLDASKRNEAKRFVTLIDALYDNHVKLICSADAPPEALYLKGDGRFEFTRTISRLMEMQSADYLASGHAV